MAEDLDFDFHTTDGPITLVEERYIFTRSGLHTPMYHTTHTENGVELLLGRRSRLDMAVPSDLLRVKTLIEANVLPAVGILYVNYRKTAKAWFGTGFLSGTQTVATAFHNVPPIQFLDQSDGILKWDWPEVLFSTNWDGGFDVWDTWQKSSYPPNLFIELSFSADLLQKWQGADQDHPNDFRYNSSTKHDMIELRSPISHPVHLDLSPLDVSLDACICVGYPGEPSPDDELLYQSTPAYKPNEEYYLPHIKTVSWGKFARQPEDSDLIMHACSTTKLNSGSPILLLPSLSTVPVKVAAMHIGAEMDTSTESRNYNLALKNCYWSNK